MYQLERITQQPGMMGGKACIRGMRVTVGMIVGQIGAGASIEDLLTDYPVSGTGGHHAGAAVCGLAS